jgi:glycine cleavage system aminomethyltransferase T
MMWGGELVLRDGEAVGQVTSAAWSETLKTCVGLAYIWRRDGDVVTKEYLESGSYQMNVGGTRSPVSLSLRPPYDPAGDRIKG